MQADDFIRKWSAGSPAHALGERAGAQADFIDLCRVFGVPEPGDPDSYCFERGLTKTGSTGGRTAPTASPTSGSAAASPGNTRRRGAAWRRRSSS
ncbi:MAG: hypothetical protein IPO59_03645 [Betaproteobacteria bacterium]|nr:hypothetical protein [Betaproteobacteria bacterium]